MVCSRAFGGSSRFQQPLRHPLIEKQKWPAWLSHFEIKPVLISPGNEAGIHGAELDGSGFAEEKSENAHPGPADLAVQTGHQTTGKRRADSFDLQKPLVTRVFASLSKDAIEAALEKSGNGS